MKIAKNKKPIFTLDNNEPKKPNSQDSFVIGSYEKLKLDREAFVATRIPSKLEDKEPQQDISPSTDPASPLTPNRCEDKSSSETDIFLGGDMMFSIEI